MTTSSNKKKYADWFYASIFAKLVKQIAGEPGMLCARRSYGLRNGGNQWSGWVAYLSFFRYVVKLDIDYSKWDHYEKAATHGGPRYMHDDFCIISDRPTKLQLDANNRPHAEDGPFCEWSDGNKMWAHHGVRVPGWAIENPKEITVEDIRNEQNEEIRRVFITLMGEGVYLEKSGARVIDADFEGARKGAAPRVLLEDFTGARWLVGTDGSTGRPYHMRVSAEQKTCRSAHEERCGFDESLILNKS